MDLTDFWFPKNRNSVLYSYLNKTVFFFVCFFTVKQGFLSLQKDLQCDIAEYLPLYRVPASHALHPGDTVWMRSEHVSFWSSLSSVRTQVQAEQ